MKKVTSNSTTPAKPSFAFVKAMTVKFIPSFYTSSCITI